MFHRNSKNGLNMQQRLKITMTDGQNKKPGLSEGQARPFNVWPWKTTTTAMAATEEASVAGGWNIKIDWQLWPQMWHSFCFTIRRSEGSYPTINIFMLCLKLGLDVPTLVNNCPENLHTGWKLHTRFTHTCKTWDSRT